MSREHFVWALCAAGSCAVSWAAYQGPPAPLTHATPPALPRPPTQDELSELAQLAHELTESVRTAQAILGRPVGLGELEGPLPDGSPLLPSGLPDNPLVPGVGGVAPHCPVDVEPEQPLHMDWRYCPDTGRFAPTIP